MRAAWPPSPTDLPLNPRLRFGELRNGIRYAWVRNAEPRNRLYLRLYVRVGSVAEEDHERGMAHLLEHLCFNGTRHFPPGELMRWFQERGMMFGADTNAYTGFYQTVYLLDLPKSTPAMLEEGLLILTDFANGLVVTPESLASEKRVIDAEEVENRSIELRCLRAALDAEFHGSRIARRLPIGERAVRARWSPADIIKFYKKWYRPENFIILVAGDLRELDPVKAMNRSIGAIPRPAQPAAQPPVPGDASRSRNVAWIYDRDLATASVSIGMVRPWTPRVSTTQTLRENLILRLARQMFNIRMGEYTKKNDRKLLQCAATDLRDASSQMATYLEEGESIVATCAPRNWKEALATCERELRKTLQFGFTEREFEVVKSQMLMDLTEAVSRERAKSTQEHVSELFITIELGGIPRTAAANLEIVREILMKVDRETCRRAYAESWSRGTFVAGGSGNIQLGAGAERKILSVYEASRKTPVAPPESTIDGTFAYHLPHRGGAAVRSRNVYKEVGVHQFSLANGVRIAIKPTKFQKNQIYISVQAGHGRSSVGPRETAILYVAEEVFVQCALKKHGFDEVRRILSGKNVEIVFDIEEESFHFGGATTLADFRLQCELLVAYLSDSGFREERFEEFRDQMEFDYKQYLLTMEGALETRFIKELYCNEARWSTPDYKSARNVKLASVRRWLSRAFAEGPLDVAVCGDVEVAETLAILRQTFGSLPARRPGRVIARNVRTKFTKPGLYKYEAGSNIKKSCIKIIFPAVDRRDTALARQVGFLSGVLNDRLRVALREKLGAAYAPEASTEMSSIYPGDGYISIDVVCAPGSAPEIVKQCLRVAGELAANGPQPAEMLKLKKAALHHLRDAHRTNEYWISSLAHLLRRENGLADLLSESMELKNLNAARISALAAQFLDPSRAIIAIVNPGPARRAKRKADPV